MLAGLLQQVSGKVSVDKPVVCSVVSKSEQFI